MLVTLDVESGPRKVRRPGIDCSLVPAALGGAAAGPNPADRGKPAVKISAVVGAAGRTLTVHVDKANCHHMRPLGALAKLAYEVLPRVEGGPDLVADKRCDYEGGERGGESLRAAPVLCGSRAWLWGCPEVVALGLDGDGAGLCMVEGFSWDPRVWARYLDGSEASLHLAASAIPSGAVRRRWLLETGRAG